MSVRAALEPVEALFTIDASARGGTIATIIRWRHSNPQDSAQAGSFQPSDEVARLGEGHHRIAGIGDALYLAAHRRSGDDTPIS